MDKLDLIYDRVKIIDDNTAQLSEKINEVERHIDINTKDLQEHMRRTTLNEERLKNVENKQTLGYLLKVISSTIITSGTIAAALYKIITLFGK